MEITITEYAERHGRSPVTARQMAQRGGFATARKLGHQWVIDENEPYPDHRRNNMAGTWTKLNGKTAGC